MATPFVKWVGGKRNLADAIISHLERLGPIDVDNDVYYEPCLGGGAVFFALKERYPKLECVLTDVNEELVNLYRVVRDHVDGLIETLSDADRYRYDQKVYYAIRASAPKEAVERAARTLYLNKNGFNGLYRTNLSGGFNVPFGKYKTPPRIFDEDDLRAASQALSTADISACGFSEAPIRPRVLRRSGSMGGAFVYFDPPYLPISKTAMFTSYSGAFGVREQRALAEFAATLIREKDARVVLSNSDMPLIRELYPADVFDIHTIEAARSVSCKGDKRDKVQELIITGKPVERRI